MGMNGALEFDDVDGPWEGNDFKNVSMASVTFQGVLRALAFLTHMNVDFDGAPNAYGPAEKKTLDILEHAGWKTGYYGLVAIRPDATEEVLVPGQKTKQKVLIKDRYNLKLDERYPDPSGRVPVVQHGGPYDGYFISITSRATRSLAGANKYQQASYINSSVVAYGALSKRLQDQGVAFGNYGMAIRHDTGHQSGFVMMEGGHTQGPHVGAVGECSHKVLLNVGGYGTNSFPTSFLMFPNSSVSVLSTLAKADNADDLPMLLAFSEEAGYPGRTGKPGKPLLDAWVAGGRTGERPKNYKHVVSALRAAGFVPPIGDFPGRKDLDRIARTA
jgi:hypothetical protein